MKQWKRPQILQSLTKNIETPAKTLHLVFCFDGSRLRELHGFIGKEGTYGSMQLEMTCRLIGMLLQSPYSQAKVMKKLKANFFDMKWEMPFDYEGKHYMGYEDLIFKMVVRELATKKLWKEHEKEKTKREEAG